MNGLTHCCREYRDGWITVFKITGFHLQKRISPSYDLYLVMYKKTKYSGLLEIIHFLSEPFFIIQLRVFQ